MKLVNEEMLTEEDMIKHFGEDFEYSPAEVGTDMTGIISYAFGEGEDTELITFQEFDDGHIELFGAYVNTGEKSEEMAQLSPDEFIQWARDFISMGETDIETLDEQYTLESLDYSYSFMRDTSVTYGFDGVSLEYIWPSNELLYFNFDLESEDATQLEFTAEDAELLYNTPGLHFEDIVTVLGTDWTINYDVQSEDFSFVWYNFLDNTNLKIVSASVDEAGNVLHFNYSDNDVTIDGDNN